MVKRGSSADLKRHGPVAVRQLYGSNRNRQRVVGQFKKGENKKTPPRSAGLN
jgi:hypothetical protein